VSPDPRPSAAPRIGILGGTFDPIHLGHLLLAEETGQRLDLDRVIFVPAGIPWRKAGRSISPPADRLAMVGLAIAGNPRFEVSSIETERKGPSFTVETLRALKNVLPPDAEIWFILGSDALFDLPNWKWPEQIVAEARLAVANRNEVSDHDLAQLERLIAGVQERIDFVPMPAIGISSSEVRRRIEDGRTIRYWVPAEVERYAREHRLYSRRSATAGLRPV
jgi:nicotinate-nucleotide adenylyltransferase